uniref:Glycosyl hydrolase family 31 C-terminal domain-containing protein n=1 Tax=Timema poppense TaxID=170557 RepID=A0A7R9D6M9_TIMPO|nr:unnamed protein product [Timema poppensis]
MRFPLDNLTYEIDYEFLWGSDLLIVPVLEENATQVSTYLPQSLWYDFYTSALVSHGGKNVTLNAPLDTIPLLVRGGSILPMQEPSATTTLTRKNNIYLLAAADELGVAAGELYWDDGDSLNSYEESLYILLKFNLSGAQLSGSSAHWGYPGVLTLGKVTVLGVKQPVTSVFIDQAATGFSYDTINKVPPSCLEGKEAKTLLYLAYYHPILAHGSETWIWKKRLQAAEMSILRGIENETRRDRIRDGLEETLKRKRFLWLGHEWRIERLRNLTEQREG